MPRRKDPRIPDAVLNQLLAGADPKTVFDPNGLLDDLKKALAERVLNANRAENIATARALLHIVPPADPQEQPDITPDALHVLPCPCPRCGARMIVIEVFARGCGQAGARCRARSTRHDPGLL